MTGDGGFSKGSNHIKESLFLIVGGLFSATTIALVHRYVIYNDVGPFTGFIVRWGLVAAFILMVLVILLGLVALPIVVGGVAWRRIRSE